jgi:hypothetical protein
MNLSLSKSLVSYFDMGHTTYGSFSINGHLSQKFDIDVKHYELKSERK